MNTTIGIYENHDAAVDAIKQLKDAGFPVKQLSLIGKTEVETVDEEMHVFPKNPIRPAGLEAGTALGITLGILTGVGIFAIPGLGFLYGAGAIVGAVAGLDFGLIGGGIATVLASVGVKDENAKKYEQDLNDGKFLIVAQGDEAQVNHARDVIHAHGMHSGVAVH